MKKEAITTENAPTAIGPYSQAVKANGFLFCSGQIPLDPQSGELKAVNISDQTVQVMENLSAVLAAGGASMGKIVKTTIYLTNLSDFTIVNTIYGKYFTNDPPARSTVEVKSLPRGVQIEVDAIAIL